MFDHGFGERGRELWLGAVPVWRATVRPGINRACWRVILGSNVRIKKLATFGHHIVALYIDRE